MPTFPDLSQLTCFQHSHVQPDEDTAAVVTALCERFTHLTDTIASDRLKPILAKPAEGLEDLAEVRKSVVSNFQNHH